MTKEEIKALQDWINAASGDELEGIMDALSAIQAARLGGSGGGGMPPPPVLPVDPDLEDPESLDSEDSPEDDLEIDDPEDLLKKKSKEDKSEDDSEDTKDLPDDPKEADKEKDGESKDGESKDGEAKDKESETDGTEKKETELVDDDDSRVSDDLTKDKQAEEAKKNEVFRRKVDIATAKKQLKRALSKIDTGVAGDETDREEIKKLTEELEELYSDLKENPEGALERMTKEEFDTIISKALDKAEDLGVTHKKITDVEARLAKIEQDNEDETLIDIANMEDAENRGKDPEFQKQKAREREAERIRKSIEQEAEEGGSPFRGDIETFKAELKKAIGDQISEMIEVEEETYSRINRWHEDDDLALPGIRIDEIPENSKPTIDVYIDQSGSWTDADVKRGLAAVAEIAKLEDENLLKLRVYYFSAILSQDAVAARSRGEYECWDMIIENILAKPKTKNVIIMTDTDIGHDWGVPGCHGCIKGPGAVVESCVWFLWKNGRRVPEASRKLRGRKGTFEYSI
jgi:hypothetical protein